MGLARPSLFALPTTVLLLLAGLAAMPADARGGDARSVAAAKAQLCTARRAHAAAERRETEAAFVFRLTRSASATYGPAVGRWVWLSRQVGWPRAQMPKLMAIVHRESGGDPAVTNLSSGCGGLLQIHPLHGLGSAAYDARTNLSYGLRLWRLAGWSPWGG